MKTFVTALGLPTLFCIALLVGLVTQGEEWLGFRGPTGLGHSQQKDLPINWDAEDGTQVYAERLDRLTSTWASPVADANGRLYFATAGVSYVIQTGNEFKVLAINDLGEPNHASAAVSRGRMFLVGTGNLYCVGAK